MTKTKHNHARSAAKAIAKERGITYQQALDIVAQQNGHATWSAMKVALDSPATIARHLDPIIEYGWTRRGQKLELSFTAKGVAAFLVKPDRITFGPGLNADDTEILKKNLKDDFGIDVDAGEGSYAYPIILNGESFKLQVNVSSKDEGQKLEIVYPSMEERLGVTNPLTQAHMRRLAEMFWYPDHGLVIVCGGTRETRNAAAEHIVYDNHDISSTALFHSDEIEMAIDQSTRWHAVLIMESPNIDKHVETILAHNPDTRILGGAILNGADGPPLIETYEKMPSQMRQESKNAV